MNNGYIFRLLLSLFLTEIIEIPSSLLFLKKKKGMLIVFLVNILTNPLVVYLCILTGLFLPGELYYPVQIVLELIVVLAEGLVYKAFSDSMLHINHPFRMSLALNSISYGIGIFYNIGVHYLW